MSSEYEIEVVTPEEGKEEVPPFLVSFPGGNIASLADGAFSVMQSESSKKRKRHVVETEVGDLRFIATDRLAMQDLSHYGVGVLDEKSNKITLYPTPHCFALSNAAILDNEKEEDEETEETDRSVVYQRMIDSFGSKKKKNQISRRERMNVNTQHIESAASTISTSLSSLLSSHQESKDEQEGLEGEEAKIEAAMLDHRQEMLPPFNVNATKAEDIFPLASMIHLRSLRILEKSVRSWSTKQASGGWSTGQTGEGSWSASSMEGGWSTGNTGGGWSTGKTEETETTISTSSTTTTMSKSEIIESILSHLGNPSNLVAQLFGDHNMDSQMGSVSKASASKNAIMEEEEDEEEDGLFRQMGVDASSDRSRSGSSHIMNVYALIAYFHYCLVFLNIPSRQLRGKKPLGDWSHELGIPTSLLFYLFSSFSNMTKTRKKARQGQDENTRLDSEVIAVSKTSKDTTKLRLYVVILYLHLKKYVCMVDEVTRILQVTNSEASTMLAEVGAKIHRKGNQMEASLSAPLTFPETKRKRQRK
jgi:hypothetical protein